MTDSEPLATAQPPGSINVSQTNLSPGVTSAGSSALTPATLTPRFVTVTPLSPRHATATPLPPQGTSTGSSGISIMPPNLNPFYLKLIVGNIRGMPW